MSIAILTRTNRIIRKSGVDQTSKQSQYNLDTPIFDIDGALISFKVTGKEFIYIDENNFHTKDKNSAKAGYCLKSVYEDYKSRGYLFGTLITELLQDKNWFDSHFESAVKDDIFNIIKLETSAVKTENYTKYYFLTEYKFKIKNFDIDFYQENQYPEAGVNTNDPTLENYSFKKTTEYNRLDKADGLFFTKNFGSKLATLNISSAAKKTLYKSIIKICFEIYWISKDNILDILAIKSIDSIKSKVIDINIANNDDSNTLRTKINIDVTLSKIDKIIAQLLLDWGLVDGFDVQVRELLPDTDGDTDYAGLYQPFEKYLTAVTNFSRVLIYYDENELFKPPNTDPSIWDNPTLTLQSNKRLKYIADVFPPSALSLISSVEDIKKIIEGYLNSILLSNSTQDYIINLLKSLATNPVDGEKILIYLLEKKDGVRTKFEILLFLFDKELNGSIKEQTQVGNLLFPFGKRQELCKAILSLWRKSNFNPNYNKGNLQYNPNFYFTDSIIETFHLKNEYGNPNSVVELGSVGYTVDNLGNPDKYKIIQDTRLEYTIAPLNGEILELSMGYYDYVSSYVDGEYQPNQSHSTPNLANSIPVVSKYHLYQPITLIAYKQGEPLLAQEPVIPAFLFYIAKDIENMKKIEEMVYFAAEVSANIILFFALGGSTILEQIVYLRYITNIGKAVMVGSAVQATDVVLVLKALEGISEAITIYGLTASQYQTYLAETSLTDAEKIYHGKIARIYFYITLIAAGGSMALRWRANELASEAVSDVKYIDSNGNPVKYYDELPVKVRDFIGELAGYETKLVNSFRQRIEGKVEITSKFDDFTPVQKKIFSKEFGNLSSEGLQQMNYPNVANNWKKLYIETIEERTALTVLKDNTKTDNIINFYKSYTIRQRLSLETTERRWLFLNEFQPATATEVIDIKSDIKFVDSWKRFRFEPNLIDEFKAQSISNRIELCKKFGKIEEKLFDGFRKNPKKISEYIGKNVVDKKLLEDNRYFWLKDNYNYEYINSFKGEITKAVNRNKTNELFTNPLKKGVAIEELKKGTGYTKGDLIEKPMRIYLNNSILPSDDVMYGVDILFKKSDGSSFRPGLYLDIDAIVVDTNLNKIKKPYSAKINPGDTFESAGAKKYDDAQKLEFFRNIPNDINAAKAFIQNESQSKKVWGDVVKNSQKFSEIQSIEIKYIDKFGNPQTMPMTSFKQKLKSSAYERNDFIEVNPTTFGTTREDLLESLYYRIITE